MLTDWNHSKKTINQVKKWLISSGIEKNRIKLSKNKSWLSFDASTAELEALLKTDYHIYRHDDYEPHMACESYSLPTHLSSDHIDFITPTIQFAARKTKRSSPKTPPGGVTSNSVIMGPTISRLDIEAVKQANTFSPTGTSTCGTGITPDCLRALYGFSKPTTFAKGNSIGIVEFSPESYVPADMDMFFKTFSAQQVGQRPILRSIGGAQPNGSDHSESNLDLQYAMALTHPQTPVNLYQLSHQASFNNLLDVFDSTYCAGDNGMVDLMYPNKAYPAKDCGNYTAPNVLSISWGYDESALPLTYMVRQCAEFVKLGLAGMSVLISSGDNGKQTCWGRPYIWTKKLTN